MPPSAASRRGWIVGSLAMLAAGCGDSPARGPAPASAKAPPIESITLERYGHDPDDPRYEVTIRRDGGVTYVGTRNVPRIGTFRAEVGVEGFRRFGDLVARIDFFGFRDDYPLVPDADYARTTVTAGGRTKAVADGWGSPSPVDLWGLQMAIDGFVAGQRDWREVK